MRLIICCFQLLVFTQINAVFFFFFPKVKVLLSAQPFVFTSSFSRCLLPFSHPSLSPSVQSKRNGRHSSGSAAAAREHQGREAAK